MRRGVRGVGLSSPEQVARDPCLLPGEVEVDSFLTRVRRLRRRILTLARLHELELVGQRSYPVMVTLTYREGQPWAPMHVARYLGAVRDWWRRASKGARRLRYVWVAELQKRGAVHYHVVFWMPRGFTLPKADKRGWWPYGSTRTEAARHPVAYVVKYASKCADVVGFPAGCRLYGGGGLGELQAVARWWGLPTWARSFFGVGCGAMRPAGGGVAGRASGLHLSSPWRVSLFKGRVLARQVVSWLGGLSPASVVGPYSMLKGAAC